MASVSVSICEPAVRVTRGPSYWAVCLHDAAYVDNVTLLFDEPDQAARMAFAILDALEREAVQMLQATQLVPA